MSLQKRSKNCLYPLYSFTHQCVEPEIPVNARSEPSRMMPIGNFPNESRVFIYSYAHVSCSRLSFRARVSRFALVSRSLRARLLLASHFVLAFLVSRSRLVLASHFVLASCSRLVLASHFVLASCSRFSFRARFMLASHLVVAWSLLQIC